MSVEHRVGDLFEQTDLDAVAQGVNCVSKMGSGIAPVFKRYWPSMFNQYKTLCESGQFVVGDVHAWQAPSGVWVYNLATQHFTGKDARLDAIETALPKMLAHMAANGVASVGLPRIGAGIGGLDWADVQEVVHRVADASPLRVVLVSLPGA